MNGQPTQVPPNWKARGLTIIALIFVGLIALYFVYRRSLSLGNYVPGTDIAFTVEQ